MTKMATRPTTTASALDTSIDHEINAPRVPAIVSALASAVIISTRAAADVIA